MKHIWGQNFWVIGYGYWSTGNITDKMANDFLEHHRKSLAIGVSTFDVTMFFVEHKNIGFGGLFKISTFGC